MSIKPPPPLNGPYELFILALSTFAVLSLAVEAFAGLDPDTVAILRYADLVICALFFLDFLYQLRRTPDRGRYLVTWGWLDLLSSIPGIAALRLGRAGRIVRIVRVLRGLRSTRQLVTSLVRLRAASTFFAAGLVALVVLVFSSAAILQFETGPTANIRGPEDAIWWAFSTITTVGYGDRYPVTTEGRLIGMLLMTVGVGLFATFSGFVASWFLAPQEAEEESEIRKLREEVGEVRPAGEGAGGLGGARYLPRALPHARPCLGVSRWALGAADSRQSPQGVVHSCGSGEDRRQVGINDHDLYACHPGRVGVAAPPAEVVFGKNVIRRLGRTALRRGLLHSLCVRDGWLCVR